MTTWAASFVTLIAAFLCLSVHPNVIIFSRTLIILISILMLDKNNWARRFLCHLFFCNFELFFSSDTVYLFANSVQQNIELLLVVTLFVICYNSTWIARSNLHLDIMLNLCKSLKWSFKASRHVHTWASRFVCNSSFVLLSVGTWMCLSFVGSWSFWWVSWCYSDNNLIIECWIWFRLVIFGLFIFQLYI